MKLDFNKRILNKEKTELAYWITPSEKEKPWIVLIHGAGADRRSYDEMISFLSGEEYRLLLLDLRGHGASRPNHEPITFALLVEDVLDVLDAEGIKKAIFIGQALGGAIAQEITISHRERVEGLGLLNCTCVTAKMSAVERAVLAIINKVIRLYSYEKIKTNTAYSNAGTVEGREYLDECISKMDRADLLAAVNATSQASRAARKDVVRVPGFILMGSRDPLCDVKRIYRQFATTFPLLTLFKIFGAGSLAQFDTPKTVAEMVDRLYLRLYNPEGYEKSMAKLNKEMKKARQQMEEAKRKEKEARAASSKGSSLSSLFGKKK